MWKEVGKPRQGKDYSVMCKTSKLQHEAKKVESDGDLLVGRKLVRELENGNHVGFWTKLKRGIHGSGQAHGFS